MYQMKPLSRKETILLLLVFSPAIIPFAVIFTAMHLTAITIHKIRNF